MREPKQVLREMANAGKSFHVEFDKDEEGRLVLASYVVYPKRGPEADEPVHVPEVAAPKETK